MGLFLVQNFQCVFFFRNFCQSHLVSKVCALSFFKWTLKRSLKSRRASLVALILKVVTDHVSDLSSFQESIVLLCLFLFHVDAPLEVCNQYLLEGTRIFYLEVWKHLSLHRVRRIEGVHIAGGIDFTDPHHCFCWKTGAGANFCLEVHLPNDESV